VSPTQPASIPRVARGAREGDGVADIGEAGDVGEGAPGESVVSREFSEEFGGCLVIEASQSGAVVIGDEGVEVGVAFGMVEKAAMVGGAVLRHAAEMLAKAAVAALDHAPRLRGGRLLVCGRKG
jgi:hypothetical protein